MPYTPAQVARLVGVSVQSIRNWSRDYAVLLSDQATGTAGVRQFNEEDVETLRTVATLRKTGLPPAEIIRRVQEGSAPPIVDAAVSPLQPTLQSPTPSPQEAPQAPEMALMVLHTAHNALQGRLEALEARLDRQAAEARTRAGMFAVGVLTGVFLVLLLAILWIQLGL